MSTWAFLDHENLPDLEHLDLSRYERILVFCGPRSKKLKIDQLPGTGFCRLEFLRLSTEGKNNLDFHLAFHLGRLHEQAGPGIAFHILSGDKGFDGLMQHLKDLKRTCKRIEPIPPKPKLSEPALRIAGLLEKAGRSRPRKQDSLLKWIASHVAKDQKEQAPALLKELKKNGQLSIQEGALTYTLTAVLAKNPTS
jgi:hypothetical protein